ncbi:hypothetical protein DYB32_004198 [Aphanomyces invadans]|uniref:TIGR01456 family HAD hydrolase n=1 Tax=Aphanomyces invadans TaxID=157072 RepID=A0A3R6VC18_9STRA|nr:hypothetical protein DYB32_004198 [Aphanomyces invadans]
MAKALKKKFGVVFDVDGVLLRGKLPIPGANQVLQHLHDTKTPYAIMTNGGGTTEEKKAEQLSDILKFDIPPTQLCLSHTPMRELVSTYENDMVLAVGKSCDKTRDVMEHYGFRNVVTVSDLHSHFPASYPDISVPKVKLQANVPGPIPFMQVPHHGKYDVHDFRAVFVLMDPIYWGREIQIIMDVLTSHEGKYGTVAEDAQHDLYFRTTGMKLRQTLYGKPERTSYLFAEKVLAKQLNPATEELATIYMVGDNPYTDIKVSATSIDLVQLARDVLLVCAATI